MNEVYTIGHSTRSFEDFLELLKAHGIALLIDVRSLPGSRRYPQFDRENLGPALAREGIGYRWMPELGGRRKTRKDSPNTGWKNASFRGYADYMGTPEFAKGIAALASLARRTKTAVMCAEAVPWRCHRSLIADALTAGGWQVHHIMTEKSAPLHKPTKFLRIEGGELLYPKP